MTELTVNDLIARIQEIRSESQALTEAHIAFGEKIRKTDEDVKLLLASPNVSDEDAERLQNAVAEFIAETYKRTIARMLTERRQANQQQDLAATTGLGGGFPRLS